MTDTANPLTGSMIAHLCNEVFHDNLKMGWWTDLATGESLVGKRNVGELLMLVVTELAEAAEGFEGDLPDDKLPHRRMFEVELADTAIRVFDIGGGLSLNLGGAFHLLREMSYRVTDYQVSPEPSADLLSLVRRVAAAMEGHRKSTQSLILPALMTIEVELAALLLGICEMALDHDLDLMGAIAEKRAFNANRADHKPENRRLAGGKRV